jgi:trans-aconitate 2-methyltransferase
MRWDPTQYGRYAGERERPFLDLIGRISADTPHHVVDLGCGTGNLTAILAHRWPEARVEGIDSSPEMIARTIEHASGRLTFAFADIADWQPASDVDVIVSNAALQWVPGHRSMIARWAAALPEGGWLALQVPGNFDQPSHVLMRELASSNRWAPRLAGVLRDSLSVETPQNYASTLLDAGMAADVWETTYVHLLAGENPVLEWVRGTGLRPVLSALTADEATEFESEYAAALRKAYPAGPHGTMFPFRRIFAVGHRL